MDKENKGFNLSVLISLLVGVISLIVVIPSISMIMNKATEVAKPEEYRFILRKSFTFQIDFDGFTLTAENTLSQSFSPYENLTSFTSTYDNIIVTLSYPDELSNNIATYLTISDVTVNGTYEIFYEDPISNEKLYGTYDFSNIILTEADQVLNPIYTPF